MKVKKQIKKSTLIRFLGTIVFIMFIILFMMLPLYYKIIWPPIIGKPASATTVDVLAFWGAFFTGIITLIGVYFTIHFSRDEIKETAQQQSREQFIMRFGAIVLEINSISFEIKKFRNYLQQLKSNLEKYNKSGIFTDIYIEFDTKDDYKKIQNQIKPDLEIIRNRFEGKAAHADGIVYGLITRLSNDIKEFQSEFHKIIDLINQSPDKCANLNYEPIFKALNQSISICENSLKDYKEKLGNRFIEDSEKEGIDIKKYFDKE